MPTDTLRRRLRRGLTGAAIVIVALLAAAGCGGGDHPDGLSADAPEILLPTGGTTTLTLDEGMSRVLADGLVTLLPVAPATAGANGIGFPVVGGSVAADTLAGGIHHAGGLAFVSGDEQLVLSAVVLDGTGARITTIAGGGPLPFLDLDLGGLTPRGDADGIDFTGIRARLTAEGATALRGAFGDGAFREGLLVGEVTIRATP